MTLYLEGKTPLTRMIFPPRRQLNESRHQVYRHGRAQGSDCDRRPEWQWKAGDGSGKLVMESIVETKASSILEFIHGLRGELHVTWEEGTWASWLYDLLQPQLNLVL